MLPAPPPPTPPAFVGLRVLRNSGLLELKLPSLLNVFNAFYENWLNAPTLLLLSTF